MKGQEERLRKLVVATLSEYTMIETNDRVLVAVSGGKDSSVMLYLLEQIRRRSPTSFELEAIIIDQKQPGFDVSAFKTWVEKIGIHLTILEEDTYSIVLEKTKPGKTYCGLCSRLRRGILYNYAYEQGFNKIALGHHRDDLNETILMNLFYSGSLASMPPKLRSDDGRNTVIRPLCNLAEKEIAQFASQLKVPIIPCNLCGAQDGLRRQYIKKLLQDVEKDHEEVGASLLAAQKNLKPTQLADRRFWMSF